MLIFTTKKIQQVRLHQEKCLKNYNINHLSLMNKQNQNIIYLAKIYNFAKESLNIYETTLKSEKC